MAKGAEGKRVVASVLNFEGDECVGYGEVHHGTLLESPPRLGIESSPFVDLYKPVKIAHDAVALAFVQLDQGIVDLGEAFRGDWQQCERVLAVDKVKT